MRHQLAADDLAAVRDALPGWVVFWAWFAAPVAAALLMLPLIWLTHRWSRYGSTGAHWTRVARRHHSATIKAMPTMLATVGGGEVTALLFGPPGELGVVAVALVGPRVVIPGIDDALWLDGGSTFLLSFGVFTSGLPVVAQLPWSGGPVPGVRAVWQGASLDANGALQFSNPALTILP